MAPKGRPLSAKAKAQAALRQKNAKRDARRAALVLLNGLAEELGAAAAQVDVRTASGAEVEFAIHVLEARCQQPALVARLRDAAEAWVNNGGKMQAELAPPPDLDSASVLFKHRVLQPEFRLRSRAFMLTYNHRALRPHHWQSFRAFVSDLKGRIGARAWAANLEQSLHAATMPDALVYHCHAYYLWTDGVGITRRCLDEFVFEGIRPRVDVCEYRGKHTAPHAAARHGLWYVSLLKSGTLFTDTNYPSGQWRK